MMGLEQQPSLRHREVPGLSEVLARNPVVGIGRQAKPNQSVVGVTQLIA